MGDTFACLTCRWPALLAAALAAAALAALIQSPPTPTRYRTWSTVLLVFAQPGEPPAPESGAVALQPPADRRRPLIDAATSPPVEGLTRDRLTREGEAFPFALEVIEEGEFLRLAATAETAETGTRAAG